MDLSFSTITSLNWSVIEVSLAIVCACVPCLKPLASKYLPRKWFTLSSVRSAGRQTPATELPDLARAASAPTIFNDSKHHRLQHIRFASLQSTNLEQVRHHHQYPGPLLVPLTPPAPPPPPKAPGGQRQPRNPPRRITTSDITVVSPARGVSPRIISSMTSIRTTRGDYISNYTPYDSPTGQEVGVIWAPVMPRHVAFASQERRMQW
jgi:hypothetical protein